MPLTTLKSKDGSERLKLLKHRGIGILSCDFSSCSRDEGKTLLLELIAQLEKEENGSVRLFFDVNDTTHDASHANEWKRHLELFNLRIKKSAIVGLSPLNRIALGGILAFGRLIGQEKSALQLQVYDSRELALDYLATDK